MNHDAGLSRCAGSLLVWLNILSLVPGSEVALLGEPGVSLSGRAFEGLSGGAPPTTAGVAPCSGPGDEPSGAPREAASGDRVLGLCSLHLGCTWGLSTMENVRSVVLSLPELFSL